MDATTEASRDIDGSYAWIRLGVSILLSTIGGAGMWAVVVVLPAVQTEFGVDRADASLPYTMTMIGFALGNVLIGRLIDRVGFMAPAFASGAALGLGFILAAMSGSITQFSIVQGLLIGCNFLQLVRCDLMIEALAISLRKNGIDTRVFPIVIRLFGPAEAEARAIAAQFPGVRYLPRGASLAQACREIVRAVDALGSEEAAQ